MTVRRHNSQLVVVVLLSWLMFQGRILGRSAFAFSNNLAFSTTRINRLQRVLAMTTAALPSNQELVQQRLQAARERKDARKQSILRVQERNFHLKEMLVKENATGFQVPKLYALKVTVCQDLREELKLSGREKRGRAFVEPDSVATLTLRGLRSELHSIFRALRKGTFLLTAGFPEVAEDGTIGSNALNGEYWKIESDADVAKTFQQADEFFASHPGLMQRPSIVIQITKDPNAPAPPPPPAYLTDLPNPAESPTITMLSFYAFPPTGIADPEDFALKLRKVWKPFQALGRVYVATEGVNAQMSVPSNVLERFMECCRSIPELGTYMENGINIDPVPLSRDEFATAGLAAGKPAPPFTNLHIRVKSQIVADGLDRPLNWQSAGYDMPPLEWHERLKQARDAGQKPIILDCRNTYESDVGRFELAEPLNTENFRDSWDVLNERLKDLPKDTPIYGYCTGGIRCVKVGAYLTQELGFTNVARLAGGIIAYDRTLQEKAPNEEPMFKGANFVFDGRLGRPITEDALGTCLTCGGETSLVSNCGNENCHKRMVQCENCRTSFMGTCSEACRQRLVRGVMRPAEDVDSKIEVTTTASTYSSINEYSSGHSTPPPSVYKEIEFNTQALIPTGSHMISGPSQGRLLTQLASMTREGRILEVGTFSGYATANLLEGACMVGQVLATKGTAKSGPFVLTMERDMKAFEVAVAHLKVLAEYGTFGDPAAEALCALRAARAVPAVKEDKVSLEYNGVATCELWRVSDALAVLESLAAGTYSPDPPAPFDLVFIDADKTRLLEYVEACLTSDRVLKKGGHIIVDNVLWKGLVLDAAAGGSSSSDEEEAQDVTETAEARKNRRARKLANKMHRFNSAIVKDPRVDVLVLPVRDGLSVIRKR